MQRPALGRCPGGSTTRRRANPGATEVGPNDELREINEDLLRISIRARDERDRAQRHLRIALAAGDMGRWALDEPPWPCVTSARPARCAIADDLVGPMHVLHRPYTQDDLAAVLQRALGARKCRDRWSAPSR